MNIDIASFQFRSASPASDEHPLVAVKILPPAVAGLQRHFHLALLLDTSGSMHGERLISLQRTLHLLLDALHDSDILTLINYNSVATLTANAVSLTTASRAQLHITVDSMTAGGGTNLEAAMTLLQSTGLTCVIDSVFILTDGRVNQGITSAAGLLRIANAMLPNGTPINTLGYGSDHNSSLLRDMAIRSRGTYTFADAAELIPAVIGDIVGGLSTEYGRNAILTFPESWNCLELEAAGNSYAIGTLIAEKEQWVVLEGPTGCSDLPIITLTWNMHAGGEAYCNCIEDAIIPRIIVEEQYCRIRVAHGFAAATDALTVDAIEDALRILQELGNQLDASAACNRPFVIRLRAQIDDMLATIAIPVSPPHPRAQDRISGGGMPALRPLLSRMSSDTAALGNQRGFYNPTLSLLAAESPYSSPTQRAATQTMVYDYGVAP